MDLIFRLLSPMLAILEAVNNRAYREAVLRDLLPLLADHAQILDVGCGDGRLSSEIMRRKTTVHIVGIDVQHRRPAQIPKVMADARHLPFRDASFEVVMAVDVLHHTPDILSVLQEMTRVSSHQVLLKDHVWDGRIATWLLLSWFDWCVNAPFGIGCAYNFPKLERWLGYFGALGLRRRAIVSIAHFPLRLNEKFNWIFLLEKSSG
jgi:SAM-dependent methyltransferase